MFCQFVQYGIFLSAHRRIVTRNINLDLLVTGALNMLKVSICQSRTTIVWGPNDMKEVLPICIYSLYIWNPWHIYGSFWAGFTITWLSDLVKVNTVKIYFYCTAVKLTSLSILLLKSLSYHYSFEKSNKGIFKALQPIANSLQVIQ